jgi:peptidoglycan/LPS O-acetylase OafA/YrhL
VAVGDPSVAGPSQSVGHATDIAAAIPASRMTAPACRPDPLVASRSLGERVQFFDLLRAFAIIVVMIRHYRTDVFPGGSIGVSVFFALSGYLITTILLGEPVLDRHCAWRFFLRRFLRVWPPYAVAAVAVMVLLYAAIQIAGGRVADAGIVAVASARLDEYLRDFPEQLLFIRNPTWLGMGVGVFWTLQVEFWFYVTMPLLMLAVGRGRGLAIALVLGLTLSLGLRFLPALNSAWPISLVHVALPLVIHVAKWFDTLLAGALVALLAHRRIFMAPISPAQFRSISMACLGVLSCMVLFIDIEDRSIVWPLMATLSGLVTCFWIWSFLRSSAEPNYPFIAWFGRISYSVYLVHAIPLDYIGFAPWPSTGPLVSSKPAAFMLAAILVAVALHYLVEKPAIRLGRFLTRRPPAEAAASVPA